MSLLSIRKVSDDVFVGIWRIDETEESICRNKPHLRSVVGIYRNKDRRLEVLCTYSLLYAMTHDETLVIRHLPSGRPVVEGYNISISHTHGYVAVILSQSCRVAIDIEYVSDRVDRVKSRFVRCDECAETTLARIVHWCAKESFFKLSVDEPPVFLNMKVNGMDFFDGTSGTAIIENVTKNKPFSFFYECTQSFVITYIIAPDCL